ncbi:MAG: multidrug effflux MFS transporter [Proteobacteria bacterium]|nr:multidrug effflux MFS transporter [Pseudomonadota bacterium]MDA1059708.1 multidrug effflux MFS transporter [Pseudomonadota bacterium]
MTQPSASQVQQLARSRLFVIGLVSTTSVGPMAMQLFVPSLPFMAKDLAAPIDVAQLALSLSMAAIALANLVYGPLSDRLGRRPVLLAGLLLFLIGTAIAAFATSVEMLVVGRIIQAGGSASGMVISRAMVRDVYGAEKAASMIAYLTVAMLAAPYVALIVGGALTDSVGWRASLWFAFIVGGIVTVIAFRILRETHFEDRVAIAPLNLARNYAHLFGSIEFTGYVLHTAFAAGTFFAFMAAGPYLMVDVLHRPALEFSFWFALLTFTFMGANFAAGRVSSRVGLDRMVFFGSLISLSGGVLLLIVLAVFGLSPLTLFLPNALVGIGQGISMPNAQAGAINLNPKLAGTSSGLLAFATMGMGAVFSQIVGEFADGTAGPLAWTIMVGVSLALISGLIPARRRAWAPLTGDG